MLKFYIYIVSSIFLFAFAAVAIPSMYSNVTSVNAAGDVLIIDLSR